MVFLMGVVCKKTKSSPSHASVPFSDSMVMSPHSSWTVAAMVGSRALFPPNTDIEI